MQHIRQIAVQSGGAAQQERTWHHVLGGVAKHYGLDAPVQFHRALVDGRLQWSQAKNVWYNSAIRSFLYAPVRAVRQVTRRKPDKAAN